MSVLYYISSCRPCFVLESISLIQYWKLSTLLNAIRPRSHKHWMFIRRSWAICKFTELHNLVWPIFRNINPWNLKDAEYETRVQRSGAKIRCKSRILKAQKELGLESESRSPRLQDRNLSWRIKRWENYLVFLINFSLPTNKTYPLTSWRSY